jgi:ankyrin repeat protein
MDAALDAVMESAALGDVAGVRSSDRALLADPYTGECVVTALITSDAPDRDVLAAARDILDISADKRALESSIVACCLRRGVRTWFASVLVRDAPVVPSMAVVQAAKTNIVPVISAALFAPDGRLRAHPEGVDPANDGAPLYVASCYDHHESIRELVRGGAAVNAMVHGCSAVQLAAQHGHLASARALCEAGAALDARTWSGSTALHLASKRGYVGVMRLLLEHGAATSGVNQKGRTPLAEAASAGCVEACRLLFEAGAIANDLVSLHLAARHNKPEVLEYLCSVGADANLVNLAKDGGLTPLHAAAQGSSTDACSALLRLGALPDAVCRNMWTALHYATMNAHCDDDTAIVILRGGGDATMEDGSGRTALHYAASRSSEAVCDALIRAGSPIDTKDGDGFAPLAYASNIGIMRLLLRCGANPARAWNGEPYRGTQKQLMTRWTSGEDDEQLAASAVRDVSDRGMLPELASICASYLVLPIPRPRGGSDKEPGAKRQRTA